MRFTDRFSGGQCKTAMFQFGPQDKRVAVRVRVHDHSYGPKLSAPVELILSKIPPSTENPLPSTLARASCPRSPRGLSDGFYVHIVTGTFGQAIGAWAVDVAFDSAVISFHSIEVEESLFPGPVVTSQVEGMLSVTGTRSESNTDPSLFTGDRIPLVNITFNITGGLRGSKSRVIHTAKVR